MSFLFGKKLSPEDYIKKWRQDLRKQQMEIDRNIRTIQMNERKAQMQVKERARAGDTESARILAKEIVAGRKAIERLYTAKAQMNSINLRLQEQRAMLKVAGAMQKSTEVMQIMNSLVRVQDIAPAMQAMEREMAKAGFIEEMISDAIDDGADEDLVDDIANEAIEGVLTEILAGAQTAPRGAAQRQRQKDDGMDEQTRNRLAALKV